MHNVVVLNVCVSESRVTARVVARFWMRKHRRYYMQSFRRQRCYSRQLVGHPHPDSARSGDGQRPKQLEVLQEELRERRSGAERLLRNRQRLLRGRAAVQQ